jgi:Bacterial EndoU nuclease
VAIDGPSGAYDDDPEQAGDSKPEKDHGHGKQQPAEVRSRTEYYEELHATDKQMAAADGPSDRPPLDSLHVTPERAKHILDGDRWGGGHRHGTGRPGKTEFPADWDDEKIIGHVLGVARAPDDPPVFQANRRWRVHGYRDEVGINVVIQPDGRIWSAWPDAGSPGVVKNLRETK